MIRRRINSLSALLNYTYAELDLDKRNSFSRLIIKGESDDSFKRGVFTNEELKQGYDIAINSGSQVKLLMPLLGETGCRLAEIVGLSLEDVDIENDLIHIRSNPARRLKTRGSQRTYPWLDTPDWRWKPHSNFQMENSYFLDILKVETAKLIMPLLL